jgi:hypothetical protein
MQTAFTAQAAGDADPMMQQFVMDRQGSEAADVTDRDQERSCGLIPTI